MLHCWQLVCFLLKINSFAVKDLSEVSSKLHYNNVNINSSEWFPSWTYLDGKRGLILLKDAQDFAEISVFLQLTHTVTLIGHMRLFSFYRAPYINMDMNIIIFCCISLSNSISMSHSFYLHATLLWLFTINLSCWVWGYQAYNLTADQTVFKFTLSHLFTATCVVIVSFSHCYFQFRRVVLHI